MKPSTHFLPEGEAIIAQDKRSEVLGKARRKPKAPEGRLKCPHRF